MKRRKVSGNELWRYCQEYTLENGAVTDTVRFLNALQLRFYGRETKDLYGLGLRKRLYHQDNGNTIFLINGRKERNV